MKSLSIITLGLASLLGACTPRPANQFDLKGSIEGANGQTIYLSYLVNDSSIVDSAVIDNSRFTFTGTVDVPTLAIIYIGQPSYGNKAASRVYLEPTEITAEGLNGADFGKAKFTGSKTQAEQDEYMSLIEPITNRLIGMQSSHKADADEARANKIEADSLKKAYATITLDFINNHSDSYITPTLIAQINSQIDFNQYKELYNNLAPEVKETKEAQRIANEIASIEAVQPGKPAPDLIGNNPQGKEIKLSDLKGKVVLIDFWATWCGPCRAALPHVKELYKKYHDKGFEVFCVGDNDSQEELWKETIKLEGIEEFYHILRGLKTITDAQGNIKDFDRSNDQSDKYAVRVLPTKYLIAADGTIIGKFDDNTALDAKLKELFGE